jgi:hypothetical protein
MRKPRRARSREISQKGKGRGRTEESEGRQLTSSPAVTGSSAGSALG